MRRKKLQALFFLFFSGMNISFNPVEYTKFLKIVMYLCLNQVYLELF